MVAGNYPMMNSNPWTRRCLLLLVPWIGIAAQSAAAEAPTETRSAPMPRPRLTEALRAKVEIERPTTTEGAAVSMEKVVIREGRLSSGPPKEEQREGPFSITQGGHVLKNRGERFSTEIGLWRHIDIIEDPREAVRQSDRIRMSFLRISW